MILKYYTNGWNYNEVDKAQVFNLRTDQMNERIASRKSEKDTYEIEDYKNDVYVYVCNRIDSLAYYEKTKVKVHLTDKFYQYCFENKDKLEFIRCVSYIDSFNEPSFVAYQGTSFLLNNEGKTVERISNDKSIELR